MTARKTRHARWAKAFAPLAMLALVAAMTGCSDDSATTDTGVSQDLLVDASGIELSTGDLPTADTGAGESSGTANKATDVQIGLHNNKVKIQLATMTVVGEQETTWDIYMAHDDGPNVYLGTGVTGQNIGHAKTFHEVDLADDTGLVADDTTNSPKKLVVGTSWRDGGAGSTGYHMTKDIYVVKLADNTYAKFEVLSAINGEVHVLCYRQADGSKDLKTVP
ncbi:MAG: hypothetical protein KAI47_06320 [Deltaproteobacteria bacterium]|nr:hypothetical protein [Deltaproteobacteria bacterium]